MSASAAIVRLSLGFAVVVAFGLALSGQPLEHWSLAAQPAEKTAKAPTPKGEKQAVPSKAEQAIVVLVNDEPVTAYQIEQRARFLALNANLSEQAREHFQKLVKAESTNTQFRAMQEEIVRANQGKTREQLIALIQEKQKQFALGLQKQAVDSARASVLPRLRSNAKDELIEERLKLQQAKKLNIEVSDDEVRRMLKELADRNKMTYDQFAQHVKGLGVDISTMGERFRAQKAWRDVVMRRYGAQIAVTQRDVERALTSKASDTDEDTVELQVSKIVLGLPNVDQVALTKRILEAEALRRRFSGCRSMAELAKSAPGARFEDLKFIRPSAVVEPTRTMLLSAKEGDVLPPTTGVNGVELYAVCGRRALAANNDIQRSKTQEDLQYKQLELLAQRYLRDIRQEAHIEFR
jgi:peptidyl-prolyl cis-trans isomerase SurA